MTGFICQFSEHRKSCTTLFFFEYLLKQVLSVLTSMLRNKGSSEKGKENLN